MDFTRDFIDSPLGKAVLRALQRKRAEVLLRGKEPKKFAVQKGIPKARPITPAGKGSRIPASPFQVPGSGTDSVRMGGPSSSGKSKAAVPFMPKPGGPSKPVGAGISKPSSPPGSSFREPAVKQFISSMRVYGTRIDELGLLEPDETSVVPGVTQQTTGSDVVDQVIIKVNALECLNYLEDVYVEPELEAVVLIFSGEMPLDVAVKLLIGLREMLPGTQVIQRPRDGTAKIKWVYLCTKEEVEIPEIRQ